MKKFTAWLLLAMVFPFLTGFDTAPTERKITLFPEGPLFFVPLASPKEPRTHVTWLRLKLPDDSFNIGSVGFGDSFGLLRWPGFGEADTWQLGISGAVLASSTWTPIPWT
jgi:hypothetical protein